MSIGKSRLMIIGSNTDHAEPPMSYHLGAFAFKFKVMEKQIELLKKYGVTDYTIGNGKTTINGYLDLSSLTSADKDFLKGTTINGYLDLSSLTSADKELFRSNVKQLKVGYNKTRQYCYFDGILTKVLKVSEKKGVTIYTTPSNFVAKKGRFTAHGISVKKAIQDLQFKIISEKLKKSPIKADTKIDINYYRLITGSCEIGVKSFIQANDLKESYKAKDLLPILEKKNAYGLERFKALCKF